MLERVCAYECKLSQNISYLASPDSNRVERERSSIGENMDTATLNINRNVEQRCATLKANPQHTFSNTKTSLTRLAGQLKQRLLATQTSEASALREIEKLRDILGKALAELQALQKR